MCISESSTSVYLLSADGQRMAIPVWGLNSSSEEKEGIGPPPPQPTASPSLSSAINNCTSWIPLTLPALVRHVLFPSSHLSLREHYLSELCLLLELTWLTGSLWQCKSEKRCTCDEFLFLLFLRETQCGIHRCPFAWHISSARCCCLLVFIGFSWCHFLCGIFMPYCEE